MLHATDRLASLPVGSVIVLNTSIAAIKNDYDQWLITGNTRRYQDQAIAALYDFRVVYIP